MELWAEQQAKQESQHFFPTYQEGAAGVQEREMEWEREKDWRRAKEH